MFLASLNSQLVIINFNFRSNITCARQSVTAIGVAKILYGRSRLLKVREKQ